MSFVEVSKIWCSALRGRCRLAAKATAVIGGAFIGLGCCALGGCPPASQYPTARAAIEQVRHTHECSRGLRGEATFDYFDPERRVRVDAFYQVAHSNRVRFDLISPLGTPLSTVAVDEAQFTLLDRQARVFHVGVPNACNVERFLRVPVPPEVLVQLLSGVPAVLAHHAADEHIMWQDGNYVAVIEGEHGASQRLVFELVSEDREKPYAQQRLRLIEVSVSQGGVLLYRAELRDYAVTKTAEPRLDPDGLEPPISPSGPPCRAEVPRRIRFEIPISERDVVFEQKNTEHNPPLLPDAFTQEKPPGARRETSVCR
jgi:hypothetical protein